MVQGLKRKFQAFFIIALSFNGRTSDSGSDYRGSNPCGAVMEKDVCKEIYDFIKEWGPDMVASELSAIVHLADSLTKEEIVARCVAIRNALWDLEK